MFSLRWRLTCVHNPLQPLPAVRFLLWWLCWGGRMSITDLAYGAGGIYTDPHVCYLLVSVLISFIWLAPGWKECVEAARNIGKIKSSTFLAYLWEEMMEPASSLPLSNNKAFAPHLGPGIGLYLLFSSCSFCLTTLLAFLFSVIRSTKPLWLPKSCTVLKALHFLTRLVCSSILALSTSNSVHCLLHWGLPEFGVVMVATPKQLDSCASCFRCSALPFGDCFEPKDPEVVLLVDRFVHLLTVYAIRGEPYFPHAVPVDFSKSLLRILLNSSSSRVSQVPGGRPDSQWCIHPAWLAVCPPCKASGLL